MGIALLAVGLFVVPGILGQSAEKPAPASAITGVWRGDYDGLPGVVIVVTDEGDTLTGAVLFYFHTREDVNHPWKSSPGIPEPMLNPKFDGTTLTFQIGHRRAHPPGSLGDPPVSFHLKLIGPDKAEAQNEREGPPLIATRSDY
jgi:hypothetical protein